MKNIWDNQDLVNILVEGRVAVMPTDTIYGIVSSALDPLAVERVYDIRQRAPEKPCIILIASIEDLDKFSVHISEEQKDSILKYSDPTSFILDCQDEKFYYLHRGTHALAFRIPFVAGLRDLLSKTGPLIAPSANTEGMPPSVNITEARKYFGDLVDMYIDAGEITSQPSRVVRLNADGSTAVLRE